MKDPTGKKDADFKELLNPESLETLTSCKVEPSIKNLEPFDRFQFERQGYFCIDPDTAKENIVINRPGRLRDTWAKVQQKQQMKK